MFEIDAEDCYTCVMNDNDISTCVINDNQCARGLYLDVEDCYFFHLVINDNHCGCCGRPLQSTVASSTCAGRCFSGLHKKSTTFIQTKLIIQRFIGFIHMLLLIIDHLSLLWFLLPHCPPEEGRIVPTSAF